MGRPGDFMTLELSWENCRWMFLLAGWKYCIYPLRRHNPCNPSLSSAGFYFLQVKMSTKSLQVPFAPSTLKDNFSIIFSCFSSTNNGWMGVSLPRARHLLCNLFPNGLQFCFWGYLSPEDFNLKWSFWWSSVWAFWSFEEPPLNPQLPTPKQGDSCMQFPTKNHDCPLTVSVNRNLIHLRKSVVMCFKSCVNLSKVESFTPNLISRLRTCSFAAWCFDLICILMCFGWVFFLSFRSWLPTGFNFTWRNSLAFWRPMVSPVMVMLGACGSPFPL